MPGLTQARTPAARTMGAVTLLLLSLLLLSIAEIALGELNLSFLTVLRALSGRADRIDTYIVTQVRLPRVVTAVAVGCALGWAGSVTQTLGRNPLATPDFLGVTAGASAAAVAAIVLGPPELSGAIISVAALLGGLLASALVLSLTPGAQIGQRPEQVLVLGLAISGLLLALTSWFLVLGEVTDAQRATGWLTGSLSSASWSLTGPLLLVLAITAPLLPLVSRSLRVLRLGPMVASGLGVRVNLASGLLLALAVLWSSIAAAAAGPISFVAFAAPLCARAILGHSQLGLVAAGLVGAVFLLSADLIARVILPKELPVGIITAATGGLLLLYLALRTKNLEARA